MKIKVGFSLAILFLLTTFGRTQELLPTFYDTLIHKNELKLEGGVFEQSTSLKNDFARRLLFGGEIEREISEKTAQNQKEYNRLGGDLAWGLEYRSVYPVFKSTDLWGWMIEAKHNLHLAGEYGEDLIGLAFLGNESYLGESANLSNTFIQYLQYYTIGGGIHHSKTKSYVSLNLVLPKDYMRLSLDKGNLSFSEDGEQIDWDVKGDYIAPYQRTYFKGLGAAINFAYNIPFGEPDKFNGVISVTGRNIGFYQLYKEQKTRVETKESFTGFSLQELIQDGGLDTFVDSLGIATEEGNKIRLLPGFLQVGKIVSVQSDKKLQSFFGVRMHLTSIYRPMIYAGVHYRPVKPFSMGLQGTFGGYGNFRLGMYASYHLDNLLLSIGTEDLLGLLLKSQYGHSAIIKAIWRF